MASSNRSAGGGPRLAKCGRCCALVLFLESSRRYVGWNGNNDRPPPFTRCVMSRLVRLDRVLAVKWSAFALVFGSLSLGGLLLPAAETALDRYVAKPDPTYSWKIVTQQKLKGATRFVVDLKSQTW